MKDAKFLKRFDLDEFQSLSEAIGEAEIIVKRFAKIGGCVVRIYGRNGSNHCIRVIK